MQPVQPEIDNQAYGQEQEKILVGVEKHEKTSLFQNWYENNPP